jgi:hypothetical protein
VEGRPWVAAPGAPLAPAASGPRSVVCDEETIAAAIAAST